MKHLLYILALALFTFKIQASDNSLDLKLIDIPAGSFMMGSPEGEPSRTGGETQHEVVISKAFKVGAYEVTQAQWEKVMGYDMKTLYQRRIEEADQFKAKEREILKNMTEAEKKARVDARKAPDGKRQNLKIKLNEQQKKEAKITRDEINALKAKHKKEKKEGTHISYGDNFPVGFVSWNEAMEFCEKLTTLEHENGNLDKSWSYRLPTEAEWEYVCRAGTTTATFTGPQAQLHSRQSIEDLKKIAWCNINAGDRKHEVGQLQPNPWGLYDIYGNVTEWCLDIYAPFSSESQTDPLVKEGPGMMRVSRGLNSHCTINGIRSATRKTGGPRMPFYALFGFRVVCAPISAETSSVPANHTNL